MEEHLPYFQLHEACGKAGCPLCTLLAGQVDKAVATILNEEVNNVFFRAKLRSGHGFCNRHAHRLTDHKDALGVAVIQKELIADEIESLFKGHKPSGRRRNRCMLCSLERDGEKRYSAILRKYLKIPELREAFEASAGLCMPHYRQATARMFRVPAWFRAFHYESFNIHRQRLEKFVSSYNASLGNNKPVLTDADKTVWRESVALRYGFRGRIG